MADNRTDAGHSGELTVEGDNSFLSRLRQAVQKAGGPSAVSRSAGVPLSTLNTYLKGQPPKWESLTAIAKACAISLDWLAEGRQPEAPSAPPAPAGPPPAAPASEPPKLFSVVNMDLMAAALEGALQAAADNCLAADDYLTRARLLCLLYDGAMARMKSP